MTDHRLVALALSFLVAGCDGTLHAVGVVRDPVGKPIANARVRLQNADERSAANGCFDVFQVVSPRAHKLALRVDADGTQYGGAVAPSAVDVRGKVFRALRNMGFRESEARKAVEQAGAHAGVSAAPSVEKLLRNALAVLSGA